LDCSSECLLITLWLNNLRTRLIVYIFHHSSSYRDRGAQPVVCVCLCSCLCRLWYIEPQYCLYLIRQFIHRPTAACIWYSNIHIPCLPAALSIRASTVLRPSVSGFFLKWWPEFRLNPTSLKHLFLNSSSMITFIRLLINEMDLLPFSSVMLCLFYFIFPITTRRCPHIPTT
jgi:hypothetical protein